jgi:glucokinase
MSTSTFLGIEIGGTKLQLVLGDEQKQILKRFRFVVDLSAGAEGIRHHIQETLTELKSEPIKAIGVGFGGPIDRFTGKIWKSYHINGWSDFSLTEWVRDLAGVPVVVDNDANVAALGEAHLGAGQDFESVFYVTMGSGIGAGLVINQSIYHGALPGECELGHVRLDKIGRTVELSCSGWAVDEKIRRVTESHPSGELARLTKGMNVGQAKALRQAIDSNDQQAVKILHETCDDFAFGLSHAVHLFHPETVVLGGGLSLVGEPLRKLVEQKLTRYIMDAFQPGPVIQLSALKEDAVPVGALVLAIQHKE